MASGGSALPSLNDALNVVPEVTTEVEECSIYTPFVTKGSVSLPDGHCSGPVRIMRDNEAAQSFMPSAIFTSV